MASAILSTGAAAIRSVAVPACVTICGEADARGTLARAIGTAATGRRVVARLPAGEDRGVRDLLRDAASRRLPLVVVAPLDEAASDLPASFRDTGAFVVQARSAQHAVDLLLVAHRVAEQSLTPGVLLVGGAEIADALQDVQLPQAELVLDYLGDPGDTIRTPTPAQVLLFGDQRRRVPAWIDPDRPVASGCVQSGAFRESAGVGRRAFFDDHLPAIIEEEVRSFARRTGREPAPIEELGRHRRARQVLVACGAAAELAQAVGAKARIVAWTWLQPAPLERMRAAFRGATQVTVLERDPGSEQDGPLSRIARTAAPGAVIGSAVYRRAEASHLAELCRRAGRRAGPPSRTRLLRGGLEQGTNFPRREVLLQRVRRDYPELDRNAIAPGPPLDVRPSGAVSLTLFVRSAGRPDAALESLAGAFRAAGRARARGRTRRVRAGLWRVDGTFAPKPVLDPGEVSIVDLVVADGLPALRAARNAEVDTRALLICGEQASREQLWSGLPASWRRRIEATGARLLFDARGFDEALRSAAEVAAGADATVEEIRWRELAGSSEPAAEAAPPLVARRFADAGESYDNVARFWGEHAEPLAHAAIEPSPDPYLALGATPPCTSTFVDRSEERTRMPVLAPDRCTGCGACWVACPDTAILPVALSIESLLERALEGASAADPLRRAQRQLAARTATEIARDGNRHVAEALDAAFRWLVEKTQPDRDERSALETTYEQVRAQVAGLPLSVTEIFFHDARRQEKGRETLTMLGFQPQACQACGICAAICPEDAIRMEPQTPQSLASRRREWQVWEKLPDTSGATIAHAMKHPRVGRLAAVLLSRHCLFSMAGGDGAEPGSGARIALRQVTAVVEHRMQRRLVEHAGGLESLEQRLREAIREEMARAVETDDLDRLERALHEETSGLPGDLLSRLEQTGPTPMIDRPRLEGLVASCREIADLRRRVMLGPNGLGRARFALVISGRTIADWAARFPANAFSVPVAVATDGRSIEQANGILDGLLARRVDEARVVRRAGLLLDRPADLSARLQELVDLSPDALTPDERALCPPVLVVASAAELDGVRRLLSSRGPVRLLLLDGHDRLADAVDVVAAGVVDGRAFVLSASISEPEHLFAGVDEMLGYDGPGLVHLHAPSPLDHGFDPAATIDRARSAVDCRVQPLASFDPRADADETVPLSLEGNPNVEEPSASTDEGRPTPIDWMGGERRFETMTGQRRSEVAARVADRWAALQRLAGFRMPFADALRERITGELEQRHRDELAAVRASHEAQLEADRRSRLAEQAAHLRERLMKLAGLRAPARPGERG